MVSCILRRSRPFVGRDSVEPEGALGQALNKVHDTLYPAKQIALGRASTDDRPLAQVIIISSISIFGA